MESNSGKSFRWREEKSLGYPALVREPEVRRSDGIAALADITGTTNYPPSGLTRQVALLSGVLSVEGCEPDPATRRPASGTSR